MDIEKMIEQLRYLADTPSYTAFHDAKEREIICDQCEADFCYDKQQDAHWCMYEALSRAATALSTLQAENEKLRDEVERQRRSADDRRHLYENAERAYMKVLAELEQAKREQSRIPEGYALVKLELLEELDNFRDLGPIDRLRELAQADKEGRCVVLPGGGYKDKDGENALKSAMNTCFYHNNPVTRFIADAVAEKLTRDEAALRRDQE